MSRSTRQGGPDLVATRLERAARLYEQDRYHAAIELLRPIKEASLEAQELLGLCYYRQGKWRAAIRELEDFTSRSGSHDQMPVIADCYRALGQHRKVEEIWERLRKKGVSKEVLAEGRIVMAGSLADRGMIDEAIELLVPTSKPVARPKLHHLRQWYVLADLLEKRGDYVGAREMFKRVARFAPDLADAKARARALG